MHRPPLFLEVSAYIDADNWNWHLKDAQGATLASHAVILAHGDWCREALSNLPAWLHYHCAPDTAHEDERRHLQAFGAWLGTVVLGPAIAGHIVAYGEPDAVVRVVLPLEAAPLLALPLELACVTGRPLGQRGVSFVYDVAREGVVHTPTVGESLRILALFSVPPAGSPLNLRGERQHLQLLVSRLAAQGRAIELRALQYGVTRGRLEQLLGEDGGWDIVHFAGHGTSGALLLERPDGAPDPVTPDAIVRLLSVVSARLKLVVLVACHSASASLGATLSWLGAPDTHGESDAGAQAAGHIEQVGEQMPAWALERGLGCALLATRYAVDDQYATAFTNALYEHLLERGEPLPHAARIASERALRACVRGGSASDRPLSMTMPMLLGRNAADLMFAMRPHARPAARDAGPAVPPFAAEHRHFVGRVRAMTLASEALAENATSRGVLFHGMAGAGKTACIVELAWHHLRAARFEQVIWYRAPELNADASMTLSALALAMETQLPGIAMLHAVASESALAQWLPVLRQTLATRAVLIVLDNVETLLTPSGHWRDQRWSMLMRTFHDHGGTSRVAMSSRLVPAGVPASFVLLTVHALPLDETLLLIRELPNLRALLEGRSPSVGAARGHELLRDTLRAVQGHPKLIEFAERLAADPERLARRLRDIRGLKQVDANAGDAYLIRGETRCDVQTFLDQLGDWTRALSHALSRSVRMVFHLLCALEPDDRRCAVVEANWQALWHETPHGASHIDMRAAIARLESCGLVELRVAAGQRARQVFAIHPEVARAGRAEAGASFQTRVDEVMVNYWYRLMRVSTDNVARATNAGASITLAGWSAFPYLQRNGEWDIASQMIERVMRVDDSPRATAMLLPLVTRMAAATAKTPKALITQSLLARVLNQAGLWREAVQRWEAVLEAAERAENFALAAPACNDLANAWQSVDVEKALGYARLHHRYASLAGTGAWSELSALGQQLQMLSNRVQYGEVLSHLPELRRRMIVAGKPGPLEGMLDWNVRNVIFDTASDAAFQYGSACRAMAAGLAGSEALAWETRARAAWRDSLKYNGKARAALRRRGALPLELARSRFNDNGPLIELERFSDAYAMLLECKDVFELENAVAELGDLYSALGTLEQKRKRTGPAREFEAKALRYKYQGGDARHVAVSHFNLANRYLGGDPEFEIGVAHRLAAALIRAATDPDRAGHYAATLKAHIANGGGQACAVLSGDFGALCSIVEAVEGVAFRTLMARLAPGREEALMKAIVAAALEA
ncbi:CHAT domain-containing protein [Paraburkholderia flagellata]|uniref:CHAT domain-containing protein n=1 Tax=Paraburkholderia flagellata TaxID=2883241 RepID=UPI001F44A57C|nr:CHAT domain-containing protein [Paraburkholderia flagellata]